MLEKLPDVQAVEKESEVTLSFPQCERVNPPVIQLDDIRFNLVKQQRGYLIAIITFDISVSTTRRINRYFTK